MSPRSSTSSLSLDDLVAFTAPSPSALRSPALPRANTSRAGGADSEANTREGGSAGTGEKPDARSVSPPLMGGSDQRRHKTRQASVTSTAGLADVARRNSLGLTREMGLRTSMDGQAGMEMGILEEGGEGHGRSGRWRPNYADENDDYIEQAEGPDMGLDGRSDLSHDSYSSSYSSDEEVDELNGLPAPLFGTSASTASESFQPLSRKEMAWMSTSTVVVLALASVALFMIMRGTEMAEDGV